MAATRAAAHRQPVLLGAARRPTKPAPPDEAECSAAARTAGQTGAPQQLGGPGLRFVERQEALLLKQGRNNAVRGSRKMPFATPSGSRKTASLAKESGSAAGDDAASASRSAASQQPPSLHPSAGGVSLGLSETTLGAGDGTAYWDFQHRKVERKDLGHRCHECKQTFRHIGEAMTERRGARISMRYHAECFSGFADPRSQARSSHHEGKLAGSQMAASPVEPTSKMRTGRHFDQGGRLAGHGGGKLGSSLGMGHLGFGGRSSKRPPPQRAPGGFTEDQLAAHDLCMEAIPEGAEGGEHGDGPRSATTGGTAEGP